jgi:hypothetical protein
MAIGRSLVRTRTPGVRPGVGERLLFVSVIAAFFATYLIAYYFDVTPDFSYYGLGFDRTLPFQYWLLITLLALIPATLLPTRFDRPSDFVLLVVYCVVYLPALIIAFHANLPSLDHSTAVQLVLTLFSGLMIIVVARRTIRAALLPRIAIPPWAFWVGFTVFCAICAAYVATVLGGHAALVDLSEVYALRTEANDELAQTGSKFGGYAFTWLNAFMLPIFYSVGWWTRRWWVCALVVIAYLLLYSVWGAKASLFAPVALAGLSLVLRASPAHAATRLVIAFALLLASPLIISWDGDIASLVHHWLIYLINMRVFSSSALLITQYQSYFEMHPLTYGSHITGVNMFVSYPYADEIPRTIGLYYYGTPMTANVSFWAQDGIAAFGMPGILVISVVCAFVFWLIDSASAHIDRRIVVLSLAFMVTHLVDTSLFTTLITGGALLLAVAFWLMPPVQFRVAGE